jgi:hypothetical protein
MTKRSTAGLAAVAWLFGSLACAGSMAREDDTAAAAQPDTTEAAEPPPGYSGMEQDTSGTEQQPTAVDTFLNEQGTGVPTDTMGYGGFEQPDTSAAAAGDTGMTDTTTTTGMDTTTTTGTDTSGTSGWSDTTGTSTTDTTGTSGWSSDTAGTSTMDTTGQQ